MASPRTLRSSTERPGPRYELADDLIAIHGAGRTEGAVLTLSGGRISVEPVDAVSAEGLADAALGPVYRRTPGGLLAVPTGRVVVRFAEGDRADRHTEELAEAGYDLEEVLAYAPHAGWVRPSGGGIPDALRKLDRLEKVIGVENVEPQMLGEVVPRR